MILNISLYLFLNKIKIDRYPPIIIKNNRRGIIEGVLFNEAISPPPVDNTNMNPKKPLIPPKTILNNKKPNFSII